MEDEEEYKQGIYIYEILEILDKRAFDEKPGFWLFNEHPIFSGHQYKDKVGDIAIQSFLMEGECVDGFKAKLVGIILGHTVKDLTIQFDKDFNTGVMWLIEHGVKVPKKWKPKKEKPKLAKRCSHTITMKVHRKTEIIQCQKYEDHPGPHTTSGEFWYNNSTNPRGFRISGLWLTSGGRIVKPGSGELCSEGKEGEIYDQELITFEELQQGISVEEFTKRINKAKRKWRKKYG